MAIILRLLSMLFECLAVLPCDLPAVNVEPSIPTHLTASTLVTDGSLIYFGSENSIQPRSLPCRIFLVHAACNHRNLLGFNCAPRKNVISKPHIHAIPYQNYTNLKSHLVQENVCVPRSALKNHFERSALQPRWLCTSLLAPKRNLLEQIHPSITLHCPEDPLKPHLFDDLLTGSQFQLRSLADIRCG
jgi:hypothetical protein